MAPSYKPPHKGGPSFARRNAFARAFTGFHDVLWHFADECEIRNSNTGEMKAPIVVGPWDTSKVTTITPLLYKHAIMELMMAQFITRLIETRARARGSDNAALIEFAEATRTKYAEMTVDKIGEGFSIHGEQKYLLAVHTFEQQMSEIVFSALAAEAEDEEFDEALFWFDVAMGLTISRQPRHPLWGTVVHDIFIGRLDVFKKALAGG